MTQAELEGLMEGFEAAHRAYMAKLEELANAIRAILAATPQDAGVSGRGTPTL